MNSPFLVFDSSRTGHRSYRTPQMELGIEPLEGKFDRLRLTTQLLFHSSTSKEKISANPKAPVALQTPRRSRTFTLNDISTDCTIDNTLLVCNVEELLRSLERSKMVNEDCVCQLKRTRSLYEEFKGRIDRLEDKYGVSVFDMEKWLEKTVECSLTEAYSLMRRIQVGIQLAEEGYVSSQKLRLGTFEVDFTVQGGSNFEDAGKEEIKESFCSASEAESSKVAHIESNRERRSEFLYNLQENMFEEYKVSSSSNNPYDFHRCSEDIPELNVKITRNADDMFTAIEWQKAQNSMLNADYSKKLVELQKLQCHIESNIETVNKLKIDLSREQDDFEYEVSCLLNEAMNFESYRESVFTQLFELRETLNAKMVPYDNRAPSSCSTSETEGTEFSLRIEESDVDSQEFQTFSKLRTLTLDTLNQNKDSLIGILLYEILPLLNKYHEELLQKETSLKEVKNTLKSTRNALRAREERLKSAHIAIEGQFRRFKECFGSEIPLFLDTMSAFL